MKGCWILLKAFSASIEMFMWFLSLLLLTCYITFDGLHMLNHPQDEINLIMVYDMFDMLLNSFSQSATVAFNCIFYLT
jgi:hypothetical protein